MMMNVKLLEMLKKQANDFTAKPILMEQ